MTMQAAFEILGIPSWHWCTMSENTVRQTQQAYSKLKQSFVAAGMLHSAEPIADSCHSQDDLVLHASQLR